VDVSGRNQLERRRAGASDIWRVIVSDVWGGSADVHFRRRSVSRIVLGGALSRRAKRPMARPPPDILDSELARRLHGNMTSRQSPKHLNRNFRAVTAVTPEAAAFSYTRVQFSERLVVGGRRRQGFEHERHSTGMARSAISARLYEGVQFGYNFRNGAVTLPRFYAGFDT